jgi:hypothetical protein
MFHIILAELFRKQLSLMLLSRKRHSFSALYGEHIIPAIVHRYTKEFAGYIAGVLQKLYEPPPVPTLYAGRIEDLLGRVPLFPCFLDGNTTSTSQHKYAPRQKQAFEYGCADGSGQGSRRGSHVYEINTWLWNFGRPQPRIGGLSVAKTEQIRRQSRSETSRRAAETKKARKRDVDQI